MSKRAIRKAIKAAGTQEALARRLGIQQASVAGWLIRGRVPAERVLELVEATGGAVTKEDLRPDLYPRAT